jgi:hypothetical protein
MIRQNHGDGEEVMQTRLNKRIPVEEKTWAQLSRLREPGETYDDLLNRLMENDAAMRLSQDLRNLEAEEVFVELS